MGKRAVLCAQSDATILDPETEDLHPIGSIEAKGKGFFLKLDKPNKPDKRDKPSQPDKPNKRVLFP